MKNMPVDENNGDLNGVDIHGYRKVILVLTIQTERERSGVRAWLRNSKSTAIYMRLGELS